MWRLKSYAEVRPLVGDWLLISGGMLLVAVLFATLWQGGHAAKLRIRQGDNIYAILSLNQYRSMNISGPLGDSRIIIDHGRVRFERSPCTNQYCVHQGWLRHAGQAAICLPNRVSLELLGSEKAYDSLNY